MSRRKNIHPYLSDEIYGRFKAFAAATGLTESQIAEEALRIHLDQSNDKLRILRRLGKIERRMVREQRDLRILIDSFGAFVFSWLAHTPEIPAASKDLAARTAERRMTDFTNYVTRLVTSNRRFLGNLVDEDPAEDQELVDAVRPLDAASASLGLAPGAVPAADVVPVVDVAQVASG
jgi:hypothetical protein